MAPAVDGIRFLSCHVRINLLNPISAGMPRNSFSLGKLLNIVERTIGDIKCVSGSRLLICLQLERLREDFWWSSKRVAESGNH